MPQQKPKREALQFIVVVGTGNDLKTSTFILSTNCCAREIFNIDVYLGPLITSARCTYISHLFLDINYTNFLRNFKKKKLGLYFEMILDDFFFFLI